MSVQQTAENYRRAGLQLQFEQAFN